MRRLVRLAAARRDASVRRYRMDALEERLWEDLGDDRKGLAALTAKADAVLTTPRQLLQT